MEQNVYVDLYFLINFSMDFLCLLFVAELLSLRCKLPRLLLAASLGSVIALLSLFLKADNTIITIISTLFCIPICAVAFLRKEMPHPFRSLFSESVLFTVTSMFFGGAMTALFSIFNTCIPPSESTPFSEEIPWQISILTVLTSVLFFIAGERKIRTRFHVRTAETEVLLYDRSVRFLALSDSGNLLHDPISGKPVLSVSFRTLRPLFPKELREEKLWSVSGAARLPPAFASRVRPIPMKTAASEALILAFRPDRVTVRVGKESREIDPLIGILPASLLPDDVSALLSPELLPNP